MRVESIKIPRGIYSNSINWCRWLNVDWNFRSPIAGGSRLATARYSFWIDPGGKCPSPQTKLCIWKQELCWEYYNWHFPLRMLISRFLYIRILGRFRLFCCQPSPPPLPNTNQWGRGVGYQNKSSAIRMNQLGSIYTHPGRHLNWLIVSDISLSSGLRRHRWIDAKDGAGWSLCQATIWFHDPIAGQNESWR